jgi:NTP pyrophosphatase (non-canonical NTP hydrolase)
MSGRVGAVKKALYYGKTPREDDARWLENMADHSQTFDTGRISPVMLHTALGVHEEGGEMLRMLASVARGEQEFDKTNWLEELGDALWFVMAGARAAGFTLEEVMEANITKLKKRYHDKFDAHRANNRDIASEREALENV